MRKMKDSGIEWIGEIPEDWEVKPIKSLFSFGKGLPITKDNLIENGSSVISYGQIHSKNNIGVQIVDDLKRFVSETYLDTNPNSLVHKGDFIFADTSEDLEGCGNFVYVDKEEILFAGYHTIILFSKQNINNKYLAYLFKTDAWRYQIRGLCSGVKLFSISKKILGQTRIILPMVHEQQQIADFLDRKCSEINSVISKTKSSIEEYKKLKQSIITEVVTGKVKIENGKVKESEMLDMKGSKLPNDWKWMKLKFLVKYNIETLDEKTNENFNFDYVDISSVEFGKGITKFQNMNFKNAPSRARRILKKGDIILSTVRTYLRAIAKIEESKTPQIASTGFIVFTSEYDKIISDYLHYAISSENFISQVESHSVGISYPAINASQVVNLKIPVPPLTSQLSLITFLDQKCSEIDNLITKKEQLVVELESYKKSLIYEVVTGKKEMC